MLGYFKNYSDYIPSKRDLKGYIDYDIDDVLKAVGLERRNVGLDVLGSVALFIGGALLGAVAAALFAPKDIAERAKQVAKDFASDFERENAGDTVAPNV